MRDGSCVRFVSLVASSAGVWPLCILSAFEVEHFGLQIQACRTRSQTLAGAHQQSVSVNDERKATGLHPIRLPPGVLSIYVIHGSKFKKKINCNVLFSVVDILKFLGGFFNLEVNFEPVFFFF